MLKGIPLDLDVPRSYSSYYRDLKKLGASIDDFVFNPWNKCKVTTHLEKERALHVFSRRAKNE